MPTSAHFERGQLLYQQGRYEQAVRELQLHLGQDAQDFATHAIMALCLARLERFAEASEQAQAAIRLAPDQSLGHYALSLVMLERQRLDESVQAIQEAIRLDPYQADYYAILASLRLQQSQWRAALETANQGLQIEPEHGLCTNLRAQALVKLGDRAGAAATMAGALARRPDDTNAHANQGWALLHERQPRQALEHFREALTLDPTNEWARAGIVEAMKARNFVYRWMLAYFLWMGRLPPNVQWGLVIGLFVLQQVIVRTARQSPALAPYLWPVLYAYIGFVLMSWLASPLFNLILRLDRFGRHALFPDQTRGANVLLLCLVVTLGWLIAAIVWGGQLLWLGTLLFAILSLPASAIFRSAEGWPRNTMIAITVGLLAAVLVAVVPLLVFDEKTSPAILFLPSLLLLPILPYALLASQFAGSYLMTVRVKR